MEKVKEKTALPNGAAIVVQEEQTAVRAAQEAEFGHEAKAVDNRLATIEGHIRAVRKMLLDDKSCIDVITQLMAIERSVKRAGVLVLKNHMNHCVKNAVDRGGDSAHETLEELNRVMEMYL